MKNIIFRYFIIVVFLIVIIRTQSFSKKKPISENEETNHALKNEKIQPKKKDQYYIVYVKNPYISSSSSFSTNNIIQKRDLNNKFIDGLVNDIHTLIVDNKNTYENPIKLDEIDKEENELRKRNEEETENSMDNVNSNYVYKISSTETKTALHAYLSDSIVPTVETMENVIKCVPDIPLNITFTSLSNAASEIYKETAWKSISIRKNVKTHLSIISQGKYDSSVINSYDDSYYYPSSGGYGISVIVIDSGFNFNSPEFKNIEYKSCLGVVNNSKFKSNNESSCFGSSSIRDHGTEVSDVVAGKKYGVAPNVNLYGIVITDDESFKVSTAITAFESVKKMKYEPNKLVINLSFVMNQHGEDGKEIIEYLEELINELSKTAVIVSSADTTNTRNTHCYPCVLDSVICAGSIDNDINDLKKMLTKNYRKSPISNYGKEINIYAPQCAYVSYISHENKTVSEKVCGTSFSSALVSGVAATIMAEDYNTKYTSQLMLKKLKSIGIKNAISDLPSGSNNLLLNNGKHTVYSKDDKYKGSACGAWAGNTVCKKNVCCSKYGYCGTTSAHCNEGCQKSFGTCK